MAESTDYYKTLGLTRSATDAEITAAFRKLAKETHPDKNPNNPAAEAKYRQISAAYEALRDVERRAKYDDSTRPESSNFFDQMFGTFGFSGSKVKKTKESPKGEDVKSDVTITFDESVRGCKKVVEYTKKFVCSKCLGSARLLMNASCKECLGSGRVRKSEGFLIVDETCFKCRGAGRDFVACSCETGFIVRKSSVECSIPSGIINGSTLRCKGVGSKVSNKSNDGLPGDLLVTVSVTERPGFSRSGLDIKQVVEISYPKAVLGGEIEVCTFWGTVVNVKVWPGTRHGDETSLGEECEGATSGINGNTGNYLLVYHIDIPKSLTDEQLELIKRLDAAMM